MPLIGKHPRQPIYVYCRSSVLQIRSEVKGGAQLGFSGGKKPSQIRQKLHLMAISAKGKSIEQAFFGCPSIQWRFIIPNMWQGIVLNTTENSKTREVQFLLWRNWGLLRNNSCRVAYILIWLLRARPFSYTICNPYMVRQASIFVPILWMGNQRLRKAIPKSYKVKTGKEVGPQSLFSVPGVTQPHTTDS